MSTGTRNLLLVLAVAALFTFLPWTQALLILLVAALATIVTVFLRQNFLLLRNVSAGELLRLTGRTLLLWSPILLFYLPQYFINQEIRTFTRETAYETGLIEHHYVTEETTLANFDRQLRDTQYLPGIDPRTREHLWEALLYAEAKADSLRDEEAFLDDYTYAFTALEPGLELSVAADTALERSRAALDLAVRKERLVGENEFQLDTELTLQDIFREREDRLTASLDSLDEAISSGVQSTLDSINSNLSSTSATAKQDLRDARRAIEQKTDRELDELERQTISAYARTFPETLVEVSVRFARKDCGFPGVGCRAMNGMKSILRAVYFEERAAGLARLKVSAAARKEKTRQKIRAQLEESEQAAFARIDRGEDGVQAYKDSLLVISRTTSAAVIETKGGIHEVRLALNDGVRSGIWAIQRYLRYLRLLSLALFAFLVVTSFIYVFSRVAFAGGTSLFVTLRRDEERALRSKLRAHGTEYTIPPDYPETFYVSKKFIPTGRAPKLAIPRPLTSLLRRLKTGTYFMNQVVARPESTEPVDFRSVGGAEFVEWTLAEGEEVVFTYDHLVAFSEGITLSSHLSLRITTLLLGRPFFHLARGPGKLVLKTKGTPILSAGEDATRSVSAERVVSWQRPARFSVQSETNLIDIYFSSLYLQRSSEEQVVIDADDGKTRQKTGLFRFVLRFLLPI